MRLRGPQQLRPLTVMLHKHRSGAVSCGRDSAGLDYRRVTSIPLSFYRLEGYLKSLGSLTKMMKFDVGGNKISGNVVEN